MRTLDVLGHGRQWVRDVIAATTVGLFLAVIGAFGSYDLPLWRRILVCLVIGWTAAAVCFPCLRALLAFGLRKGLPVWLCALAAAVLTSTPVALVVRFVEPVLMWPGRAVPPPPVALYLSVLAIIAPGTVLRLVLQRRVSDLNVNRSAAGESAPRRPPPLIMRLPSNLKGEVLALQAEDHYVRIHTSEGSTLLLLRMADAINELKDLEGLRVHRSWWIARSAVVNVRAEGRRLSLDLRNGLSVPVTRGMTSRVRRAGWV